MDNIYKTIEECNPNIKRKIMVVFYYMIADILINPIVTKLFIRGKKLNIFLAFITQFYFATPKNIRLNSTHYFIMKTQKNESFNKLHLIIDQILTLKSSLIFFFSF